VVDDAIYGLDDVDASTRVIVDTSSYHDVLIDVDRDWVAEALSNVIKNGLLHSPRDSAVHIQLVETALSLRIDIRDHGEGISPGDLPRVFERFFMGSSRPHMESVGIGLYIARMIVRAHGGEIRATSTMGEGSCFSVVLPFETVRPDVTGT
jgi:K+-sensing histidine kinase KdpD